MVGSGPFRLGDCESPPVGDGTNISVAVWWVGAETPQMSPVGQTRLTTPVPQRGYGHDTELSSFGDWLA